MVLKISALFFVILVIVAQIQAFARRDVAAASSPNMLESFQRNLDQFRQCIDQTLGNTLEEVNVKRIQPVLSVIGDSMTRITKAFDDLTSAKKMDME